MTDEKKPKKLPVSIPEVFDRTTGEFLSAETFLVHGDDRRADELHLKRREITRAKKAGNPSLVCAMCHEPVMIAGGLGRSKQRLHFRHFKEGPTCPHQSRENLDAETIRKIKYNGAKESRLHKHIKNKLQYWLEKSPLTEGRVRVEETFFHQDGGREWRRPDVSCTWNGLEIVFEVQISSDFLDVIISREDFYREQGVFIIWVFNELDTSRFTTKDIYVGNQKNVFMFNDEIDVEATLKDKLLLECRYKEPRFEDGAIVDDWKSQLVDLESITFDSERMQAFYYDYDAAENSLIAAERALKVEKLRSRFEKFWCQERQLIPPKDCSEKSQTFDLEIAKHLGLSKKLLTAQSSKVIDTLYSIKNCHVFNYNINLYSLVDVMFNCRKPYIYIIAWALKIYGHSKNFEDRTAFKNKIEEYHRGIREKNPEYTRDHSYDPLFQFLFPELAEKL